MKMYHFHYVGCADISILNFAHHLSEKKIIESIINRTQVQYV